MSIIETFIIGIVVTIISETINAMNHGIKNTTYLRGVSNPGLPRAHFYLSTLFFMSSLFSCFRHPIVVIAQFGACGRNGCELKTFMLAQSLAVDTVPKYKI